MSLASRENKRGPSELQRKGHLNLSLNDEKKVLVHVSGSKDYAESTALENLISTTEVYRYDGPRSVA